MSSSTIAPSPTITPDVTQPDLDDSDEGKLSHYAKKEDITKAYITGTAIEALCGKVWVPSRDPHLFPTCTRCKEILGHIKSAPNN